MEPGIGPIVSGYALLLLLGLPVLAALDARRELELEQAARHRRALYASVAVSLIFVAGLTFGVAIWQGVPAAELGWRVDDAPRAFLLGAAITVGGLAAAWLVTAAAHAGGLRESPVARALMPRGTGEKRAFLLLAGVAALCEEYVFRGFLLFVLADWSGSPWLAATVVSVSFGLAHGYQRVAGVLRAGTLGMVLAVPVVSTGSLFPAILAHFWINAAIGLGGWRWLIPVEDEVPPGEDANRSGEDENRPGEERERLADQEEECEMDREVDR